MSEGEKKLSKNEQKRLAKQAQKEKERLEKEAKRGSAAPENVKPEKVVKEADPSDPQEYFNMRVAMINNRRAAGENPFPHKFNVTISLAAFVEKYERLQKEEVLENEIVSIAGRVYSKRESGKNLVFYDVHSGGTRLQVMANARYHKSGAEDFTALHDRIKRGDIVGFTGYPTRTKTGELSILPLEVEQLTPCLRMLPHSHYGLKDKELRYRMRYLDLIVNPEVKDKFVVRSKLTTFLRRYLDNLGFLE
ncbi:unnamed protein product, partial [Nippostrongylus brasiliensis]|uniref:Lysine--tRNA ligase n=1 Tax=Nippostrongylus brasiliensis TaxID=27835 RepID=A0A0N4XNH3_NIPBR